MKSFVPTLVAVLIAATVVLGFQDRTHYSDEFKGVRTFRVFTPTTYNPADANKRYPVIYYFHGSGGEYFKSGYYPYWDYGQATPELLGGKPADTSYQYPNNVDWENYTYTHECLIIAADGNNPAGLYMPYNFTAYVRELVRAVDSQFNTKASPQYRALTGLSMGGHAAITMAAGNPDLFRSASNFCHSPGLFLIGEPAYKTPVDPRELWRNFRNLPFRTHTNTDDYLRAFSEKVAAIYTGAGFENQFRLCDYCRHGVADHDSMLNFHMATFEQARPATTCFSFMSLYPSFDAWGYRVTSNKAQEGWVFLRDVADNGMGIHTRYFFPFGKTLADTISISVKTTAIYSPGGSYLLGRYHYATGLIDTLRVSADGSGSLILATNEVKGVEIGVNGGTLNSPVFLLSDTTNENIYIRAGVDTALNFAALNLSPANLSNVTFTTRTDNNALLTVVQGSKTLDLPALSKTAVAGLVTLRGTFGERNHSVGYIKIKVAVGGTTQNRERIIQVNVLEAAPRVPYTDVKIFDGKTEVLSVFKYSWSGSKKEGSWNITPSTLSITEGTGNGNGVADSGEVVSLWMTTEEGLDPNDLSTWHPALPLVTGDNPALSFVGYKHHGFSTGRGLLSAQWRVNRTLSTAAPAVFHVMTEYISADPVEGNCHRSANDKFEERNFQISLPLENIRVEKKSAVAKGGATLEIVPNPSNPTVQISFSLPKSKPVRTQLAIFTSDGRKVKTLCDQTHSATSAANYRFTWKGESDSGKTVAGGVYLCRLNYGKKTLTKQVVLQP